MQLTQQAALCKNYLYNAAQVVNYQPNQ